MGLTDARLRTLKPRDRPFRLSDGGGLYVQVAPGGSVLWRMAYRFAGKQKTLSFGAYPTVSLAKARKKRDEARAQLASGVDPAVIVREARAAQRNAAANTFGAIADELIAKAEKEGLAETTTNKKRWLLGQALPALGARPIKDITAAEILVPLKRLEADGKLETARRLRGAIGQVFRYAIATARADVDPTYGLRGALITPQVTHFAAVIDKEAFGDLVRAVWSYDGAPETVAALKLMALLYPRPGELRQALWDEFDLNAGVWTVPTSRMKMRRPHRKPLSALAVTVLNEIGEISGSEGLVFPSPFSKAKPISENTLNVALRRLGFASDQATAHGFRSSASSLLNESGLWSPDAIEAELAHQGTDEVRRAYHRARYWDERVRMAEWWAAEICELLKA